jgi:hypothetical protein
MEEKVSLSYVSECSKRGFFTYLSVVITYLSVVITYLSVVDFL